MPKRGCQNSGEIAGGEVRYGIQKMWVSVDKKWRHPRSMRRRVFAEVRRSRQPGEHQTMGDVVQAAADVSD